MYLNKLEYKRQNIQNLFQGINLENNTSWLNWNLRQKKIYIQDQERKSIKQQWIYKLKKFI